MEQEKKSSNIELSAILSEIEIILKDELIATFERNDEGFIIAFANGQKFRLRLEEIA